MIAQELVPDSHDQVFSLFAYVGRAGAPLASVVGRKVRQGPLRFGTSAVFKTEFDAEVLELGLRLLDSTGYRGFAHIEFARDPGGGSFKVLEVNTRLPVWAGIAMNRAFDVARTAYDDLCDLPTTARETFKGDLAWVYLAKDLWVSAQMARRRELSIGDFLSQHVRTGKIGRRLRRGRPAARARKRRLPPLEARLARLLDANRHRGSARLHDAVRRSPRLGLGPSRSRGAPADVTLPPRPCLRCRRVTCARRSSSRSRARLSAAHPAPASAGSSRVPSTCRAWCDCFDESMRSRRTWFTSSGSPAPSSTCAGFDEIARKRPLVLTAHNAMPRRARAYGAWREALTLAARVVVHSSQAVERLADFGIDRAKIVRIPHAVFDSPDSTEVEPPSGSTLLFFGLIRRYKGLDVLVSALPEIRRRVPETRLVVAGDPLEPIEPVLELASSLGVCRCNRLAARLRPRLRDRPVARVGGSARPALPRDRVVGSSRARLRPRTAGGRVRPRRRRRCGPGVRRRTCRHPQRTRLHLPRPARPC